MPPLPIVDFVALVFFVAAWVGYHFYVDRMSARKRGLNAMMNLYRVSWMEQMSRREVRIVDTAVTASLQNGTAFFASTSLIAIGATAWHRRCSQSFFRPAVRTDYHTLAVGGEGARPRRDFRLRVLQIRMVVPA